MEAGLDSLGAVDLRNALATQFSVELPSTVTFNYPTLPALAAFIASLPSHGEGEEAVVESAAPVDVAAVRYASC
jgi:hypothetical protein